MVIWHLKQIGKVKKLNKWVPPELPANKKKTVIMKYHLLLLYTTMNHFLNVMNMTFNEKWIEHDNCNDRLRDWIKKKKKAPKHLPKPNLHQKRSWSLLGGLFPI